MISDIIQLLPDHVANQIAAGEVVQRPASAVKELLENAIDAGADNIKLIVRDAGKSLIHVIDNGCGMSVTDARKCFERHATSKIRQAQDLFSIRTMGFRGEAMASIAAIAQVELKTKRIEDEVGTSIVIEGSEIIHQIPDQIASGTNISVKNLFFNVPARRNFLKSNPVELRHIVDEFQRIALSNPDIFFSMHSEGNEIFHLPKESLKHRIVHLFGNNYNQRLVPMEEETTILSIRGFIGKPEYAKKTRGEQFFYVNKRFVKDPYLNHAILNAYQDILPADTFPFYVLFIDIDPSKIDINVHPTKTEIKYEDEKSIYAILRSATKRSLGHYNITPTLDFNQETSFDHFITNKPQEEIQAPTISFNPNFNPFETEQKPTTSESKGFNFSSHQSSNKGIPQNWDSLYSIVQQQEDEQLSLHPENQETDSIVNKNNLGKMLFQLHGKYIVSQIQSGLLLVDQQRAHERVLYENFLEHLKNQVGNSQQLLFPQTLEMNAGDFALMEDLKPSLETLGFQVRPFGKRTYIVDGIPAELTDHANEVKIIEKLLEDFKNNKDELSLTKHENLAKSLARSAAITVGTTLDSASMNELIDKLFACEWPNVSLNGKPIILKITMQELLEKFNQTSLT